MNQTGRRRFETTLGKRQRETLALMARNGGRWPTQWQVPHARRMIFDSLIERGLIVRDGHHYRTVRPR